jgi:hypothetical protein
MLRIVNTITLDILSILCEDLQFYIINRSIHELKCSLPFANNVSTEFLLKQNVGHSINKGAKMCHCVVSLILGTLYTLYIVINGGDSCYVYCKTSISQIRLFFFI